MAALAIALDVCFRCRNISAAARHRGSDPASNGPHEGRDSEEAHGNRKRLPSSGAFSPLCANPDVVQGVVQNDPETGSGAPGLNLLQ